MTLVGVPSTFFRRLVILLRTVSLFSVTASLPFMRARGFALLPLW